MSMCLQVGGVLAELQAEQARLRQLCSQQAAAMQDLQRQAQQAVKQVAHPCLAAAPQMPSPLTIPRVDWNPTPVR